MTSTIAPNAAQPITLGEGPGVIPSHTTTLTAGPGFEAPSLDSAFLAATGLSGPQAVFGGSPNVAPLTATSTQPGGNGGEPFTLPLQINLDSADNGFGQLHELAMEPSLHGIVDGGHTYVPLFDAGDKDIPGDLGNDVVAFSRQFGNPQHLALGTKVKAQGVSQAITSAAELSKGSAGAFAVISTQKERMLKKDGSGGGTFTEYWLSPLTSHSELSTRLGPKPMSGPLQLEGKGAPDLDFQAFSPNLVAIVDGTFLAVQHQPLTPTGPAEDA